MLREPSPQQYQFETITFDERVPEDHLVCKTDAGWLKKSRATTSTAGSCAWGRIPSTLRQNRICPFNDSDVFQHIFDHSVEQAFERGMTSGRVLSPTAPT
jgi:hypothetical protein